jgi:hypothetical protein
MRRAVQAMPGADQLRISGAKISMPQASPCHQVHQFAASSAAGSGCSAASGSNAMVGAMMAPSAITLTKRTTSRTRAKRRGMAMRRPISVAIA